MTTRLVFSLPLPPSVNHSHRRWTDKHGRVMQVPTKRAMQWTADARDIAYESMRATGWTCPQDEKVIVRLFVWWPDRRRRDTHNLLKLLLDALEGIAYNDDRYALPHIEDYGYDKGKPRIDVTIRRK